MRTTTFASVMAIAASACSALSVSDAVSGNYQITKNFESANSAFEKLTSLAQLFSVAPDAIIKYQDAYKAQSAFTETLQGDTQYTNDEQRRICDALAINLKAHDKLLATVITKESYFQATPFEQPVATELRADESGALDFIESIRSKTPACKNESFSAVDTLSADLVKAINAYSNWVVGCGEA